MKGVERLRYTILAVQREGNRQLAEQFARIDLTPSQAEVIRVVHDHGPLTLTALGQLLICETGTSPSRLVDRLVQAGLVERVASDADRRQVILGLSAIGRTRNDQIVEIEAAVHAAIDARLDASEITRLTAALERLIPEAVALGKLQQRTAPFAGRTALTE